MSNPKPNIIYYPPKREAIECYAKQVGNALGYTKTEDMANLTNFIKAVARMKLKALNGEYVEEFSDAT